MSERGKRKTVRGIVTSDKMQKTIVVTAVKMVRHPRYRKYVKRSSTYRAHDENREAKMGDQVEITETRPLSKMKRWRLVRVIGN